VRSLALTSARQGGDSPPLSLSVQGPNAPKFWKAPSAVRSPTSILHHGCISIKGPQGARPASRMAGAPTAASFGVPIRVRRDTRRDSGSRREFDLLPVARAPRHHTLESGWIPLARWSGRGHGRKDEKYREWLPAGSYEGTGSIAEASSPRTSRTIREPYELGPTAHSYNSTMISSTPRRLEKNPGAASKEVTFGLEREARVEIYALVVFHGRRRAYKFLDDPSPITLRPSFDKGMMGGKLSGSPCSAATAHNARSERWPWGSVRDTSGGGAGRADAGGWR